ALQPTFKIGSTTITSPHTFPLGLTTVTVSATDSSGITEMCTFTVNVLAFTACIRDDMSGNLFTFNSVTGAYKFTRCSDGFMVTGTGTVQLKGSTLYLTDTKNINQQVVASYSILQGTGQAVLQVALSPGGARQIFYVRENTPHACTCA